MKGPWTVSLIVAAIALPLLSSAAHAEFRGRSFARLELDSATTPGLWGEIATSSVSEDEHGDSASLITVEPRVLYGWENWEVGLFIPYERLSTHVSDPFFDFDDDSTDDGVGDIRLSGKGVFRSEFVDVGFGLEMTLPSGDEDNGLGSGKVGFLPFGTGAVHLGPVDLRAHAGYLAYVDQDQYFGVDLPPNLIVYGGGPFAGIGDYVALRAEFLGFTTDSDLNDRSAVSFQPGIDFRIPAGPVGVLIRPTGLVGLTDEAPDWGVGGAITVSWNPGAP